MGWRHAAEVKLEEARRELAARDATIVAMRRSERRLEHLYRISTLLMRFHTVEQTVPAVVALIDQSLPLRSATFLLETAGAPRAITWRADGEAAEQVLAAGARAREAYDYLVSSRRPEAEQAGTLPRSPAASALGPKASAVDPFVILPLVVDRGSIFGVLQVEGAGAVDESDLFFINAVVNQLAIALERQAAERALRASEERLAGIVSLAADAIISIDEAQRIVMFNTGAETIFGWSQGEVLGEPIDILLPERVRELHGQHLGRFAAANETARQMGARRPGILGRRKSGEEFPAEAAISKLKIDGGWVFTAILRDISEHVRIEHEEHYLAEVGEVLADSLDLADTVTSVARLALGELGDFCVVDLLEESGEVRRLEVVSADPAGASAARALQAIPLDRNRPHLLSAVLDSGAAQLIEDLSPEAIEPFVQGDEHRAVLEAVAPVSMIGVPLVVRGRLLGALAVISSRPERRHDAADLRLLEELGRRAALAVENARLYHATRRAVQVRDEVLGIVAHDLRNPLSAILMQTEVLLGPGGEAERLLDKPYALLKRAATRMDRLIRDLLDVTGIEAGRLSVERAPVLAGPMIHDFAAAHEALLSAGAHQLRLDVAADLPGILADRERLLQVFENLIGNAVKFTAPGGLITLGARESEAGVRFWVADTGEGIAGDDLSHLFDRFWQSRRSRRAGAGLGLAIVKGIVEAHDGRIWVESIPGNGSTFHFTVPAAP